MKHTFNFVIKYGFAVAISDVANGGCRATDGAVMLKKIMVM